jgi:hypothetical protein
MSQQGQLIRLKSTWMSNPIRRMSASLCRVSGSAAGATTATDSCSRHTWAGRGAATYFLELAAHTNLGLPYLSLPERPWPSADDRRDGVGQAVAPTGVSCTYFPDWLLQPRRRSCR